MTSKAIDMCATAIGAVVGWFEDVVTAIGAGGLIIGAIAFILVVSLLIVPLRGGGLSSPFGDFVQSVTYKGKYSSGEKVKGNKGYKGKFEKRKAGGHRASPRR